MIKAHTLSSLFSKRIPGGKRAFLEDFTMRLPSRALALLDPPERKSFLEHEIQQAFGFRHVEILSRPEGPERFSPKSTEVRDLLSRVQGALEGLRTPFLNLAIAKELGVAAILTPLGATYVFPIRQRESTLGILVIDSTPETQLGAELEQILLNVCAQTALVLDNSQLLAAKLRLQDKLAQQAQMAQLGEMTARIAHEIKNPLSSIKTIVQVMQEDATVEEKYSTDLRLIVGEIDRLGASVVQLLNFARPDPGPRGSVRLQELTGSVIDFLRRDIEQIAAVVENQIPDDLPQVVGGTAAHREILLNLLLNALQAGGKGTHVWVQAWEGLLEDGSEKFVLIVVEDDGPGISAEIQRRVFEPFFTTKQRGAGLGLAIVKRNVEYFGGRIMVESPARKGRGTRFLMHLPVA